MSEVARACERLEDREILTTCCNNIGLSHYARGEYEAAPAMYQKAAPVLEEIGDRAMLATVLANLAVLYLEQERKEEAEAHLRRSVTLFDELGLDTDDVRGTRRALQLGLEEGWEAVRQLIGLK